MHLKYLSSSFQAGILILIKQTCSLEDFFQTILKLDTNFIDKELPTILLNNNVVDDLSKTFLQPDFRLALSGAMPGVVGATLRRNGAYAKMRENVSFDTSIPINYSNKEFLLTVHIYNNAMEKLEKSLLTCGFFAKEDRMLEAQSQYPELFTHNKSNTPQGYIWVQYHDKV